MAPSAAELSALANEATVGLSDPLCPAAVLDGFLGRADLGVSAGALRGELTNL